MLHTRPALRRLCETAAAGVVGPPPSRCRHCPLCWPVLCPALYSFTALDALKGWLQDKSGGWRAGQGPTACCCLRRRPCPLRMPACLRPARRRLQAPRPALLCVLPAARPTRRFAALPAERVQVGESREWLASRREDVEAHAAHTLQYDWCGWLGA